MPPFTPDLTTVQAGFVVLPKGEYELAILEPKSAAGVTKSGENAGQQNIRIMFPMKVVEGPSNIGARLIFNCYVHTPETMAFSKQFVMAALGYPRKDESRFDKDFKGADWDIDPTVGSVGDVWRRCNGSHIKASVDVQLNKDTGDQQQKWLSLSPVAGK